MRKIIVSILFLGLAFGFLAQATATSSLPNVIITPDSPFYFIKSWEESIQTFFTFGAENKAKQYFHLAEVRFAEYQKMIEKGKTEIAQKTLDKYQSQLNRALDKTKELQNNGVNVTDLSQRIQDAVSGHISVLQENLQTVPEQAKNGIENAIENANKILNKKEETQIANPASVNCENQGGKLEIRKDNQGNESGFCVFPNGSECEEWAFFRGGCKKGESKPGTPKITVLSPNGGENWRVGQTYEIRWKWVNNSSNLPTVLTLLDANKKGIKNIKLDAAGESYSWTIPTDIQPGQYYIDAGNGIACPAVVGSSCNSWIAHDTSDAPFSIVK